MYLFECWLFKLCQLTLILFSLHFCLKTFLCILTCIFSSKNISSNVNKIPLKIFVLKKNIHNSYVPLGCDFVDFLTIFYSILFVHHLLSSLKTRKQLIRTGIQKYNYSGGSNSERSNSESMQKRNVLKFGFRMVDHLNTEHSKWPL